MNDCGTASVVCLGFFDGVHRGHLALLRAARQEADRRGLPVCVHTFDPAPGGKGPELTTLQEREMLLMDAGADIVAVTPFDDAMRRTAGEDFFRQVVLGKLRAAHVICGDDHRFGYKGQCGVPELRALCREAGVGLTIVPPVTLPDGTRISSTALRQALQAGDVALAREMLGREPSERMLALAPAAQGSSLHRDKNATNACQIAQNRVK